MTSSLLGAGLNLSVSPISSSKILVTFPKPLSNSKNIVVEQMRKKTEILKNELRDRRRKEINQVRSETKDKNQIRNFELQIQQTFEKLVDEIDKELKLTTALILK